MHLLFVDGRGTLLRHPSKQFASRDVTEIRGVVSHHAASKGSPADHAEYHVGPNHVCASGCAGLAYTLALYLNEPANRIEVWQAHDLDRVTPSQGGHGSPIPGTQPNTDFLAILVCGDFRSASNRTGGRPHIALVFAWAQLIMHLLGISRCAELPQRLFGTLAHLSLSDLYGHEHFGKAACPGDDLSFLIKLAQESKPIEPDAYNLDTIEGWQRALVTLGYPLGTFGPAGDGVDGQWGTASKRALVAFQKARGLPPTAIRDDATRRVLIKLLPATEGTSS